MKVLKSLSLLTFCFGSLLASKIIEENDTPIIGVLSQEISDPSTTFQQANYYSFIAASYIKFLESSGARIVPIWIGQSEEYYRRVIQYTNGLLFPGGGANFSVAGGYGEAATRLYNIAVEYNDKGVYYPVWGTCLGMEVLMFTALNGTKEIQVDCYAKYVALPLDFEEGYQNSKLFSQASNEILQILSTQNTTYNAHLYCITKAVQKENGLSDDWHNLATNKDINGFEFISAMEHNKHPIYGVQFHPEKNLFEFKKNVGFTHSLGSIKIAQYFSNYFVNECRKNSNRFPNDTLEAQSLIYNFNPDYTGLDGGFSEQTYYFLKEDFEKVQLL